MSNPLPGKRAGETTSEATADRRASERIPFSVAAEVTDPGSEMQLSVRIADINLQGCYVDSMHVFPAATKVQVTIGRGRLVFKTPATVVYSLSGLGMGLHFFCEPGQVEAWLERWTAQTAGTASPADSFEPRQAGPPASSSESQVIRSLLDLLMRKGLIAAHEGAELLRKMPPR